MDPDSALFLDLPADHQAARGHLVGSIFWFLPDASAPGHVLCVDRLLCFGADEKPDHRRDHFFLRDHAAVLSRPDAIHPAERERGDARSAWLFFCAWTHGDIRARSVRYPANRPLCEHDDRDARAHPSSFPIAQMETVTTAEERETPKKIHRLQIGLNVIVQIVLVIFLAAMVNSLAFRHYKRWDFSRDQKYALSDKTKRFLESMPGKMRITVFFASTTPITGDVQSLLAEYQYAAKGKIDIETIDPERNLSRAKELFDKYKVVTDESLLVLDYGGRNKTVKASEMADVDTSGMQFGEGPRVIAFKGEQAITGAMMDLVEGKKNTLGYVTGHKEPPLGETPSPISLGETPPRSPIPVLKTFNDNEKTKFPALDFHHA